MKRHTLLLSILILAAGAASASDPTREINQSFNWNSGQEVAIDFGVGEMRVEAHDGSKVEVEILARCRWEKRDQCAEALGEIEVTSSSSDRRLKVDIESDSGWRRVKLEIEATVRVPRAADLHVDMGVGELDVQGGTGDVRLELGVGEARLRYPEARAGSVSIDAGVGEAKLHGASSRVEGKRSLLVGSEVEWDEGGGGARIEVEVGVGEARVWLE